MPQTTFEEVLEHTFETSTNAKLQGDTFEQATAFFLKNDPLWQSRFDGVWVWNDAPTKTGQDICIDLVARDALDGSYWVIQCKCYQEDALFNYKQLGNLHRGFGKAHCSSISGNTRNHEQPAHLAYRLEG